MIETIKTIYTELQLLVSDITRSWIENKVKNKISASQINTKIAEIIKCIRKIHENHEEFKELEELDERLYGINRNISILWIMKQELPNDTTAAQVNHVLSEVGMKLREVSEGGEK